MQRNLKLRSVDAACAMQAERRKAIYDAMRATSLPASDPVDMGEWAWAAFFWTCAATAVVVIVIGLGW